MIHYTNNKLHNNIIKLQHAMLKLLINEFKHESDVINGSAFIMGRNIPKSWYDAISTCGYCVKVSQVFVERKLKNHKIFKNANTLSIAIDPNLFGVCGDGSPNSWHTAIDTGFGYMIDLTIAQFGSKYNNRFIWNKVDWLNEFQAIDDNHDVGEINYDDALRLRNTYNNPNLR